MAARLVPSPSIVPRIPGLLTGIGLALLARAALADAPRVGAATVPPPPIAAFFSTPHPVLPLNVPRGALAASPAPLPASAIPASAHPPAAIPIGPPSPMSGALTPFPPAPLRMTPVQSAHSPRAGILSATSPQSRPAPGAMIGLAMGAPPPLTPGQQCLAAIRATERAAGIPEHLLAAIARVESGRADGQGGVTPWPWSINVEGVDHVYETKSAAVAAVAELQARGVRSIDVGCLQVNLMHHPDAFESLEYAFDPGRNAVYAAKFLKDLFAQSGSWERATALYHSATPGVGEAYQRKVATALPEEQRRGDAAGTPLAAPMAGSLAGSLAAGGPLGMVTGAMPSSGAITLGSHAEAPRVIFAANGGGTPLRGLDAYRAAPVPIASRLTMRPPT